MVEVILILEGTITKIAVDVPDLTIEGRVVSIFTSVEPEFVGVVMVDVLVNKIIITVEPFDVGVGFLLNFAVAIVDEEPSNIVSLMSDILDEVSVSFTVQIGISVSGEV